ncbi:MAG: PTS sugar transporter subunit IIA [Sporolactobacillus sp.]
MTDHELTFDTFFKRELVFLDADWDSAAALFQNVADVLERKNYVAPTFRLALAERESNYPTGLQTPTIGAAIPHADPVHIRRPFIAVIRPSRPIHFAQMGGDPNGEQVAASLIFMLGVMRNGMQVQVLQRLMELLADQPLVQKLMDSKREDDLLSVISRGFAAESRI